jgi:hypothetical protein
VGAQRVESPEALFGAGIDAVVIAATTSAHAALLHQIYRKVCSPAATAKITANLADDSGRPWTATESQASEIEP